MSFKPKRDLFPTGLVFLVHLPLFVQMAIVEILNGIRSAESVAPGQSGADIKIQYTIGC